MRARSHSHSGRTLGACAELLEEVEELGIDATGALVLEVGGSRTGALLVEGGRLCWAQSALARRRLSDLIAQRSTLGRAKLSQVFERCRLEHRPLGETLVADGLITPEGLRAALLDHTLDALEILGEARGARKRWLPHVTRTYDARFTFPSVELLVELARRCVGEGEHGQSTLQGMVRESGAGAAFARPEGLSRPIAVAAHRLEGLGARELAQLAQWAVHELDIASAFDATAREVMGVGSDGRNWIAWREGALLLVAVCERTSDAAAVLGRLRRVDRSGTRVRPRPSSAPSEKIRKPS